MTQVSTNQARAASACADESFVGVSVYAVCIMFINVFNKRAIMKVLAGIIGGLILAIIGAILVTMTFAASPAKGSSWGAIGFFAFWVVGIIVAIRSTSAAKAWRKLLISSAVLSLLLPLSGLIFTGSVMTTYVDSDAQYAGAQAAGAAIGGGLVTGFMGIIGFSLGAVFLVIGLLVGRDKQVVYVQTPPSQSTDEKN